MSVDLTLDLTDSTVAVTDAGLTAVAVGVEVPGVELGVPERGSPGPTGPPGPPGPQGISNAVFSAVWSWVTKTTDAANAGQVGTNVTGWDGTAVNINKQDGGNVDRSLRLDTVVPGDEIVIQHKTDASRFVRFMVTAESTDQGTWVSFPVTELDVGGAVPNNNTDVLVLLITQGPSGPTGPAGALGPTGPTGAAGPSGATGAAGSAGPTGATGSAGLPGPTGPGGQGSYRGFWNTSVVYHPGDTVVYGDIPHGVPDAVWVSVNAGDQQGITPGTNASIWASPVGPTGPVGPGGALGPTGPAGAASTVPGPTGPTGPTGAFVAPQLITALGDASVPLAVRNAAGQTGSLFELQSAGGSAMLAESNGGRLTISSQADPEVQILSSLATSRLLLLKAAASMSAHLLETQDSGSTTTQVAIDAGGIVRLGTLAAVTAGKATLNPNADTGSVQIIANAPGNKVLTLRMSATPTAEPFQVQDNLGNVLARIGLNGEVVSKAPDVQTFTGAGSYTWNKPAGAVTVRVIAWGGGGGGGSGGCSATTGVRTGGAGGSGGGCTDTTFPASALSASETVTVGVGGTAGGSVSTSANGNAGGSGGSSGLGPSTGQTYGTRGQGGGGGGGGQNSGTASSAGSQGGGMFLGGQGATDASSGAAGSAGGAGALGGGGGGGGGGLTAGNIASNGGNGGTVNRAQGQTNQQGSGGVAGGAQDGTQPTTAVRDANLGRYMGIGGSGGGASNPTAAAGAGAAGLYPGGGGGGGGASSTGFASGAGGAGGDGAVIVITYFGGTV